MTERIRVTEYLDLDLEEEGWRCHVCGHQLGSARANYKEGCLVHARDPREIHEPEIEGPFTFAPDPDWVHIVEFYCPGCGTQMETEYLPPGHPITHDIELDIDSLKRRLAAGELTVRDGRLAVRDGGLAVRDGGLAVRDGGLAVSDGGLPKERGEGLPAGGGS